MNRAFFPVVFAAVLLLSGPGDLVARPDPAKEYLSELQIQKAENRNPQRDIRALKLVTGKSKLQGIGVALDSSLKEVPSPSRTSIDLEIKLIDLAKAGMLVRFGQDEWRVDLGLCPLKHSRLNLRNKTKVGQTMFELAMFQPISRLETTGCEFWGEKIAQGNKNPYMALRLTFDKAGELLVAALYTVIDASQKETVEIFVNKVENAYGVGIPNAGTYSFKNSTGKKCAVDVGKPYLQLPSSLMLESKIDGVEYRLSAKFKPEQNHFGHDLVKAGAPFSQVKTAYDAQLSSGILPGLPGLKKAKNRAVSFAVDAQGKPLYISCFSQILKGDVYELFLPE